MLLTVLVIWAALAVPAAVFVAALGRSGLREDQALGHLASFGVACEAESPARAEAPAGHGRGYMATGPLVAAGPSEDAARHDG